ncbi:hypothetical protein D1872_268420 [compost metagenome]
MQLKGLTRRQPNRAVPVLLGNPVHHKPLLRRYDTARRSHAQHELVRRLQFGFVSFVAQIAIVLHVAAVVFHQTVVVFGNGTGDPVCQRFGQTSAQIVALDLYVFHIAVLALRVE